MKALGARWRSNTRAQLDIALKFGVSLKEEGVIRRSITTPGSRKISRISAALCVLIAAIIIIAVLSWHFGTATKCQASCGSSSNCVLVSQWCDGVKHCPNGEDESSCLRMYGPNFQLQAYSASKATWLPVCADNWGDSIGRTACQDIGYSSDTSSPSLWKAFIGKIKMPSYYDSSAYSVDRIIVHPDYSSQTNSNDIALMKLKTSIAFSSISRPVCLPNYGMQWEEGQPCYISGWGTTSQKGSISSVLKYAMVPLISPTTCNQTIMYNGAITSSMICAGYPKGGVDSCQGDSGGPLVTKTNSLWWLVGDTSWGDGCANVYRPGVYGNMTVFLQWIYLQMQMYS
eukprot:XP_012813712.2 PREDICTED: transmembrane protease serine 2-like [Xenopus tropicalis]